MKANRPALGAQEFAAQWERWHQDHERRRAGPHGFLAITGLHWLGDEPERFDDVPGAWSRDPNGVRVLLSDDEELTVDGEVVTGRHLFEDVDEQGIRAYFGDAVVEVSRRDGHFIVRPRHPENVVRARYVGTPTYPPSIGYVVTGTLVPYGEPRSVGVGASVEGLTQVYRSPGAIEFELAGEDLRLIAFDEDDSDELFIVFSDATSGETTYAACRFLNAALSPDGRVTLDFNRATNPPCAYTEFATCPLPPAGNDLPVRIEAGEKVPLQPR
jgi:uncharacterized protein (DUF1684 family)